MSELSQLLSVIDEAFDRRSWHGTTLYGSLRGLDVATASARPAPGRHNIWELIVHAAYWKYTVRRRLEGGKRGSFTLVGSNWFVRPEVAPASAPSGRKTTRLEQARALERDIGLLVAEHKALRAAISRLSDAALSERAGQGTKAFLIRGIAAHDLYHAGQIQLLKRLGPRRRG